tara:strand:- start:72 stop:1250 length:1179 start_codon:yes stop_codon:yes gene_type:complete
MNFSYFCNATNFNKKKYSEVLKDVREIASFLDQSKNYETIWLSEHHLQTTQNWTMECIPNPMMLGTDLAARTENINIGLAAAIITFHNPIRLAEDIAMLDNMSDGRLMVGVGRGVFGKEAIHMNVEADLKDQPKNFRLFVETLKILREAWSKEYFSHHGEFYNYPADSFQYKHPMVNESEDVIDPSTHELKKLSLVPRPYQKDLKLWQVVDSPTSIKFAAENNLNCLMWLPTLKALKERFEIYQQAKSETEQRDVELGDGICLVRDVFVADTTEEAKEIAGEHFSTYMKYVSAGGRGCSIYADPGEEIPNTADPTELLNNYDWIWPRNQIVGDPAHVIDKIRELKSELNLSNLAIWSSPPGLDHKHTMNSLKLFNEKVVPYFKDDNLIKKVS